MWQVDLPNSECPSPSPLVPSILPVFLMDEQLIEAYDNFVVGNYAQCLDMSRHAIPSSDFSKFLWQTLIVRCHLGLNHLDKVKEFAHGAGGNPALEAAGYMAVLLNSQNDGQRRGASEKILETANSTNNMEPVSCYFAAISRAVHGDLIDAINYGKAVASTSPSEFNALQAQFCLAINRPDLAEEILKKSLADRDDSAAHKLATAMFNLITNKFTDAYLCYSDLIAQFNGENSLILANGRAASNIQRQLYVEAQEDLETVLAGNPDNADSLANLACCLVHQGKSSEGFEVLQNLKMSHPSHPLVQKINAIKTLFTQ